MTWRRFESFLITPLLVLVEEDNAAAKFELISHQNIATCFLKMGSPSDALVHCEKALKLDKDGSAWKARMRKGEAYLQQGRHDDAKEIFEVPPAVSSYAFHFSFFDVGIVLVLVLAGSPAINHGRECCSFYKKIDYQSKQVRFM